MAASFAGRSGLYMLPLLLWFCLTLSLFVLGILADNADASLSLDDLALFADRFHR